MTPTREERKAAIEFGHDCIVRCADGGESGDPDYERHAAVLRAMLENFDAEQDFKEAAMQLVVAKGSPGWFFDEEDMRNLKAGLKNLRLAHAALVAKQGAKP